MRPSSLSLLGTLVVSGPLILVLVEAVLGVLVVVEGVPLPGVVVVPL